MKPYTVPSGPSKSNPSTALCWPKTLVAPLNATAFIQAQILISDAPSSADADCSGDFVFVERFPILDWWMRTASHTGQHPAADLVLIVMSALNQAAREERRGSAPATRSITQGSA